METKFISPPSLTNLIDLENLKDQELHFQIKKLVEKERRVLTQVLRHLLEIEKRRLYCDYGYGSLFDYAVKELKYSEGQAGRRIQAIRLMKEIPELEKKIESGTLSLSNVSQAQSFFKEVGKSKLQSLKIEEKIQILKKLENKSKREGEKELLKIEPIALKPKERERLISETETEIRFVMNKDIKEKLEELRSLLGPRGIQMSFSEIFSYLTEIGIENLKKQKFGKKRITGLKKFHPLKKDTILEFPTRESSSSPSSSMSLTPPVELKNNSRYISQGNRYELWLRDKGQCTQCGSKNNLNIDHIKPIARGGSSHFSNLRILCFHCNQRAAIKVFGLQRVRSIF